MKRRVKAAVIQLVVFAAPVPLSRDLHWIRHTGRLPLVRTEGVEDTGRREEPEPGDQPAAASAAALIYTPQQ